jgi:ATP/maltotriose-dependent transcriptional regulator MalT/DNA-binding SARP family transcriptional activator
VATTYAPGRIARPGLARALSEALDKGSVLLVAGPGYGKTMALEEALADRRAAWVSCGDSRGEAGRLLMAVVEGLTTAAPGLVDVTRDRLAAGLQQVDVQMATTALLGELERLLVEPLAIVFDDAEQLEEAPEALALIDRLLGIRWTPLRIAVATRRPLRLRIAKLRAAGGLTELGPGDLTLSAGECEALLRVRHGRPVTEDEVEAALASTEGWPMGVALTSLTSDAGNSAVPREGLFHYLAEEVFERLDPDVRLALVDSSVPATLTPGLAGALGLPSAFLDDTERSGLFLRTDASGMRSYHPLFRAFLREHLIELRSDDERAALHGRAAEALRAEGRTAEAIEHWLEAGEFERALGELIVHGRELLRTSPGTVRGWLDRLPNELRDTPDFMFLSGDLLWGAGQHERSLDPLRAAVAGYREAGHIERDWLARAVLADGLLSVGAFDELATLVEGWDRAPTGAASMAAAAVAWYHVIALGGRGRQEEAETLMCELQADPWTASQFKYLEEVARVGVDPGAGRARDLLESLSATVAGLELDDPHGRLPYALNMAVLVLRDLGERDATLEWLDRCERAAERVGLGFVTRDCQLQRAILLAAQGDLSAAELGLARAGERRGTGWRGVHRPQAEAHVAALRGDTGEAIAAAQRALERVAPGPLCFRVWAAVDLAPLLAELGAPELARDAIDTTLAAHDEGFPGERGRFHRARLLAARACLEYAAGQPEPACESMRRAWEEAGEQADQVVRAHWPALQPVLWHALAKGAITPEAVLPAMQSAFPGGEALSAMIDHPEPAIRRAALLAALAANHPAVIAQLAALAKDDDAHVAAAAAATASRLRTRPPPLRFELLGGFRVRRAGWELDEAAWKRPMAARIVRFLLLQGSSGVPEDALFDAFWSDRTADAARQHLTVALSRARKVLDLPDAEQSVIEAKERTYRLRLRDRDTVDADQFETAAAAALAERGRDRRAALEAAAALWTGEPLPEDRYAEWSEPWRERLVHTYSHVLTALVESYTAAGEHHEAIRVARRLLELDPLDERAHRELMVAYARTGRTSQALRQYLECRRALVTDLGVEPSAETSGLQSKILAGEPV